MEIKGVKFTFSKMNARKQFHVLRRLTPVLQDIAPLIKLLKSGAEGEDEKMLIGMGIVEQVGKALGGLKDEDADFILDNLLDTVSRDAGNGLGQTPIRLNGTNMFPMEIDMPAELTLAFGAIKANFTDFIPAIRSILTQGKQVKSEQ